MDAGEYLRYTEARQMAFCTKQRHRKFRDWLNISPNMNLSSFSMDLLNYLAYELVSVIMDCALKIRYEMDSGQEAILRLRATGSKPAPLKPTVVGQTEPAPSFPSQQVAMALAQKIRQKRAAAGAEPLPLNVGIDALLSMQIQPFHLHEAIRRIQSAPDISESIGFGGRKKFRLI